MATAKRKTAAPQAPARKSAVLKDPRGGLTPAGRAWFRRKEGAHLKPGVTKPLREMTPTEMRRKGSFLRRHFAHLRGPLTDDQGRPTRLALSAHAWGEPVPKTAAAAARLARKGTSLLERYEQAKTKTSTKTRTKAKSRSKTKSRTKTKTRTKTETAADAKGKARKAPAKRAAARRPSARTSTRAA